MKFIIVVLLLIVSVYSNSFINSILGRYTVGKQCSSSPCDRTYLGNYNFACPKAGNNAKIYNTTQYGVSAIEFDTYNVFGSNGEFYATFTQNNIRTDYYSGQSQIQIPMKKGYTLNIMPCYDGKQTSSVCKYAGNSQLAVWKTNKHGYNVKGCEFSLTRYASLQQEEDEQNFTIEDFEQQVDQEFLGDFN